MAGTCPAPAHGQALTLSRESTGVALEAQARCGKRFFREAMLFTHRGLSGPAILQISSYWSPGATITIDPAPAMDDALRRPEQQRHQRAKALLVTVLGALWPSRLAQVMSGILADRRMANPSDGELMAIA